MRRSIQEGILYSKGIKPSRNYLAHKPLNQPAVPKHAPISRRHG